MKRLAILFMVVCSFCGARLAAQESTLFTMSTHMPQVGYLNPACFPSGDNVYLALPNFNINFISPVSMNNIMQYDPERNKTVINLDRILDTLSPGDFSRLNMTFHMLGFGFRTNHCIFTFSSQLRMNTTVGIPYGLFRCISDGNMDNRGEGNELKLVDGSLFNMNVYAEYAIGAGYSINKLPIPGRVLVAARPKLLVGYTNISTVNTDISLYTSEDLSTVRLDVAYQLLSTSALSLKNGSINVTDFTPNNRGFALDLGARYNLDNWELCVAVLDMGGIHWRDNIKLIAPENGDGEFTFTGLDVTGLVRDGQIDSTYIPALYDTLVSRVKPVSSEGQPYYGKLPTKFNISASYRYKKLLKAGLTFHGELYNGNFYHTTVLSGDIDLANWLEIMAGFSIIHNGNYTDWFNPGIGASVSLFKALQIYAMVDYTSSLYLMDAKSVNIYGGLNLMLFRGGSFYERNQAKKQQKEETSML